ncbi:MAG: GNAT family N-acetyltransferase, partial [Lachnospiraceae bacterium]|nr:GNAT family N-acetyltransferase [Lachnospiraceae bacterium]
CLPIPGHDLSGYPFVLEDAEQVEDAYLDMIDARLCGYPMEILRTERTIVREICETDVDGLYEIYRDPEITRYMEDLYEDKNEERSYTRDYIKWHYGLYGFGMWIIADLRGRLIGRAGFEQKEDADFPELGFMIRKQEQGKGLAFEVCDAIISYVKERFEWKGVRSRCHPENEASICLLKKLGFQREDVPADEEGYISFLLLFK